MEPHDLYHLSEMVLSAARFASEKGAHVRARELYGIALDGLSSVETGIRGQSAQQDFREQATALARKASWELGGINKKIDSLHKERFKSIFSG